VLEARCARKIFARHLDLQPPNAGQSKWTDNVLSVRLGTEETTIFLKLRRGEKGRVLGCVTVTSECKAASFIH
jgi:hypothetical protein